jgi:hypothetical protein
MLLVEAVKVAVVAHEKKRLGGDLDALRTALADRGVTDPIWYQVPKSKQASKKAKQAVGSGAEVLLVWGGDGTVRRCLDAVAGSGVSIGILPAGSANLLAANLGIREDLDAALETALHGSVRVLDVGVLNDERFAVMAGAGFDAVMVRDADDYKDRLGRFTYLLSGIKALRTDRVRTRSTSMATAGSRDGPAASWWATSGWRAEDSSSSPTRIPMTASSRSASSPPMAPGSGPVSSWASSGAEPPVRLSCARPEEGISTCASIGACPTRSTAEIVTPPTG